MEKEGLEVWQAFPFLFPGRGSPFQGDVGSPRKTYLFSFRACPEEGMSESGKLQVEAVQGTPSPAWMCNSA